MESGVRPRLTATPTVATPLTLIATVMEAMMGKTRWLGRLWMGIIGLLVLTKVLSNHCTSLGNMLNGFLLTLFRNGCLCMGYKSGSRDQLRGG